MKDLEIIMGKGMGLENVILPMVIYTKVNTNMEKDMAVEITIFLRFVSGAQYIGEYQNGKKHGCGTINNPDGSKYEGQWFNGQKNGSGTYHYVNGDIYEGEWSRDQRNGHGKYIYYDTGSIMEGFWMNGNLNGTGRIVHKSYRFCGVFVNGKQVGNGSYFFDNGLEQQGYFRKINKDQVENKCNQSELEWSPTKLIQLKKI
ncbi:radial spoke head 1 homolog isoform X2 [Hydra vulgaris]|uniref:radial spoke head 1 homolog isoform X2 n=1 Tax=Hydra vulgaris TaxID=6087 RepID=UPI001F5EDB11|nr:radial spoke head 1 homolog isoform X2 [Hydra vulgaris]